MKSIKWHRRADQALLSHPISVIEEQVIMSTSIRLRGRVARAALAATLAAAGFLFVAPSAHAVPEGFNPIVAETAAAR